MDDIPTGRIRACRWCKRPITEVQDPSSFVIDWGDDGDYGCGDHPLNNDYGTYGHYPDDPTVAKVRRVDA